MPKLNHVCRQNQMVFKVFQAPTPPPRGPRHQRSPELPLRLPQFSHPRLLGLWSQSISTTSRDRCLYNSWLSTFAKAPLTITPWLPVTRNLKYFDFPFFSALVLQYLKAQQHIWSAALSSSTNLPVCITVTSHYHPVYP